MQKHHTRRKQLTIRWFTYGCMTIAVVFGLLACFAWVSGFRLDLGNREISQVSLVQFRSFPSGANVDINDKKQSFTTPGRQNVKSGATDLKIYKNGYNDWSKTVTVRSGEIRWIDYVRLIPQTITTDSVKSFDSIKQMMASPDKHWLLLRTTNDKPNITLADISDPKNIRFSQLTIPADMMTTPPEGQTSSFSLIEWDDGSRFVMIKHDYGAGSEIIRLDRKNPGAADNLTRDFNLNISSPHFAGSSGNVFYALTGTDLRKFDVGNKSVSAPLVTGVSAYNLYGDSKLAYVATTNAEPKQQIVGVYVDGKNTIVRTYDSIKRTFAQFTHYYDSDYLAIGRGETVSIIPSPLSAGASNSSAIYLSSPGGMDFMEFSESGRFVVAGLDMNKVSYDLETGDNYVFQTAGTSGAPYWVDEFHMVNYTNGEIELMEFDGTNRSRIVSGRGAVVLSSDGRYLLSLGDGSAGAILQRSKMIVD